MKTSEIKKDILRKMPKAIAAVQKKVDDVCAKYLNVFYGEYEPSVAIRTYQVFNSLVKSDIRRTGNGFEADVYFDLSALNHPISYTGQNGMTVNRNYSESSIMSSVMIGSTHGGAVGGTPVFTEADAQVAANARQWLAQELRAAGIPIR